ncbi:MAG: hypothetical protein IJY89_01770, partial [Clostridia bacterium]|nr:hypothetical protein [Clostridia bacterium]
KSFSARLYLDKEHKIAFEFPEDRPKRRDLSPSPAVEQRAKCPLCAQPILKGKSAYGCRGYKDGCTFRLPLVKDNGPLLTDSEALEEIKRLCNEQAP